MAQNHLTKFTKIHNFLCKNVVLQENFLSNLKQILDMNRSRSGISPVVATVILVAIAIVIAIAVAFWATGLVGIFTRYEKIEIVAAYYNPHLGGEGEEEEGVVLIAKNTGSADATIDDVYINGRPSKIAGFTVKADNKELSSADTLYLEVGKKANITVTGPFARGVTYELAVHTASGKLYPVAVLIP